MNEFKTKVQTGGGGAMDIYKSMKTSLKLHQSQK
jgi:hypothetical protein